MKPQFTFKMTDELDQQIDQAYADYTRQWVETKAKALASNEPRPNTALEIPTKSDFIRQLIVKGLEL